MRRCVSEQPLDLLGDIQQDGDILVPCRLFLQPWLFLAGLLDRQGFHPLDRDQLRQAVALAIGHLHDPGDITHRHLRQKRTEGDNLRHPVAAVLLLDVSNHFLSPVLTEIDVKIRHRYAFWVQKPLE